MSRHDWPYHECIRDCCINKCSRSLLLRANRILLAVLHCLMLQASSSSQQRRSIQLKFRSHFQLRYSTMVAFSRPEVIHGIEGQRVQQD